MTQGGKATVIDWDRMAIGDPARDLGSFHARLDLDVIRGIVSPQAAGTAADAFLRGYTELQGSLPDGLATHRAAALLALATEGFRERRPDWAQETEAILTRVETLLPREAAKTTPGLADALDAATTSPKLAPVLGMPDGTDLLTCLLRHKAGRRALVRFEMAGAPPVIGKLRAKGPDQRTPALHKALRAAGLDGRAPRFVGVPDLVGELNMRRSGCSRWFLVAL